MSRYPVPAKEIRVEHRASNSRFLATVTRADSVDAAKAFIARIRAEMPDATHHVHAYRIGYGASVTEGMTDDGEPSGTSGPPALAVLRGAEIGDIALVITRYFGGTKLGTGGLVSAYGAAAKLAVAALPVEEKVDRVPVQITLPYRLLERATSLFEEYQVIEAGRDFAEAVTLHMQAPEEHLETINAALRDLSGGSATLQRSD